MNTRVSIFLAGGLFMATALTAAPAPRAIAAAPAIVAPVDRAFPGVIRLDVDLTDTQRRIVRVHETISAMGADTILLYPQWLPGTHAPQGPIDRFAGLRISAQGARVAWTRDPVDMYAFHVQVPAGVQALDIEFQYLSPTSPSVGQQDISPDITTLEWNQVVLYPAGFYARRIPVEASVSLPTGWSFATALETAATTGAQATFARTTLETLIDSPLYAGRYSARIDLAPGSDAPVHLNLFADRPELLVSRPEQIEAHRALVRQAASLYGSHHFAHYDFLLSISDAIHEQGLEHHQSSEDGGPPEYFTEWDKTAAARSLLPHEFTHSWNGKFRRPADLWTPNFNVPMRDSLLWVYEGQTEYWGEVLTARSGLWSRAQALDSLAMVAAYYDTQAGRRWRPLADTTSDEIINPRRPMSWGDWQRFEDYYAEGQLIWLDADTLIRERSHEQRSLDDFARSFFGVNDGSVMPQTYLFADVVQALNAVEPYDWATFLRERVDLPGRPAPLDGLRRGGYRLVYSDAPNELQKSGDEQRKRTSLDYSLGVSIDEKDGTIQAVVWESAAFHAGLTEGTQILAVNGVAYSGDLLKDAIRQAATSQAPIELIVKAGDRYRQVTLDYHAGLRYPHLERDSSQPARLDLILAPRP